MRQILPGLSGMGSANQRLPSGPDAMPNGKALTGYGGSNVPDVVMRPISVDICSVNQMLPSAPAAMECTLLTGYTGTTPAGVMRPIWTLRVNQTLPSGP